MKKFPSTAFLLLFLFGLLSFNSLFAQEVKNFEWIIGNWKNTKDSSLEKWAWNTDKSVLLGVSFKVINGDTNVTERASIACEVDGCYFIADVPENNKPVKFKIARSASRSFVADNPAHDFPKFIQYNLTDKKHLNALIGAGNKLIQYKFER